jgi:hypothetical protein
MSTSRLDIKTPGQHNTVARSPVVGFIHTRKRVGFRLATAVSQFLENNYYGRCRRLLACRTNRLSGREIAEFVISTLFIVGGCHEKSKPSM